MGKAVQKYCRQSQKGCRRSPFPPCFTKFLLIIYSLLKMMQGQQVPDPDPELIKGRASTLPDPNTFSKTLAITQPHQCTFMYAFLSNLQQFLTPRTSFLVYITNSWTNTRNPSRTSPNQSPMSACPPSRAAWRTFKTSSRPYLKPRRSQCLDNQKDLLPSEFPSLP